MRFFPSLALVALAPLAAAALVACSSSADPPRLAVEPDAGDARAADASPQKDGGAQAADADAAPVDPPSALRTCVQTCERAAPAASVQKFYASLQACSCQADLGNCGAACPTFCPSGPVSAVGNACGDCVVRGYDVTCAAEVKCDGDSACVDFADCARSCGMTNP